MQNPKGKYAFCHFKRGAAALQKEHKCVKSFSSLALQLIYLGRSFWHPYGMKSMKALHQGTCLSLRDNKKGCLTFFLTQLIH